MHHEPLVHVRPMEQVLLCMPSRIKVYTSVPDGTQHVFLNCRDCRVELRTCSLVLLFVLAVCKRDPCVNSVVEPLGLRERFRGFPKVRGTFWGSIQ